MVVPVRRLERHHLDHRATGVVDVVRDLVALHATDACSVFLSVAARTTGVTAADVERALYDDRSIVRMLGMRRTVFVVPTEVVPVVQAACTDDIAAAERKRLVQLLDGSAVAKDADRWLAKVERSTVDALVARKEATAAQLCDDVPELRLQFLFGEGKRWEGMVGLSTRLLFVLAAQGRIVRGRPRGSWSSTQYRWAPAATWFAEPPPAMPAVEAEAELARLWLGSFGGPTAAADLKWWTGWTVAKTKRALANADGTIQTEPATMPARKAEPAAALLPALDPTVMGWKERAWYLGDHGPALFDHSGNAGPTVWWDGRVVGGWAQRKDGEIVWRLLEDAGRTAQRAVAAEADRIAAWLGDVRVTPRFRTPLERELSA
jgi:hypothetical protein